MAAISSYYFKLIKEENPTDVPITLLKMDASSDQIPASVNVFEHCILT